jgi:hypothetical protein
VSIIPAGIRFIQCLKRYHDSRLNIHIINVSCTRPGHAKLKAGKYASTMLQYALFVLWRSRGSRLNDGIFVAWVVVAFIYSSYSCAWVGPLPFLCSRAGFYR